MDEQDAECILQKLHGRCLRLLSGACAQSFQGLSAAARTCRQRRMLGNQLCRKLVQLDEVCGWMRHASREKSAHFFAEVVVVVGGRRGEGEGEGGGDGEGDGQGAKEGGDRGDRVPSLLPEPTRETSR